MKMLQSTLVALVGALMFTAPAANAKWPFGGGEDKVESTTAAIQVYRLDGALTEKGGPWDAFGGGSGSLLHELVAAIDADAARPEVTTLVFKVGALSLGVAQGEELAAAIARARKAGKRVLAHFESAELSHLAAFSTADELALTPEGSVAMPGLRVEVAFYKDLLGTLGLEADIEAVGDYKSAMEPFTRTSMSDAARLNLESLVDSLFATLLEAVAGGRKMPADKVKAAIDQGLFYAEDARKAGLVDQLVYWPELLERLESTAQKGKDTVALAWPRAAKSQEIGSIFDLFKLLGGDDKDTSDDRPKVALLVAEGAIVEGRDPSDLFSSESVIAAEDMLDELHAIEHDGNVKAIVLRVNSPGGSALASDIIWRELARLNKKLPVVVSMGNVAASGGYYIASAGRKIFADPMTLTGSIGVFGGKIVYRSMLDKVGVQTTVIARGQNAGMFSALTRFSDAEREVMRDHMRHTYDTFVNRVAKGRNMSFDAVHKVAQGRVWTGRQAAEVGLVDKLGGLADALTEARRIAKLPQDAPTETYPRKKNLLELFDKTRKATDRIAAPSLLAAARALPSPLADHALHLVRVLEGALGPQRVMALSPFALSVR